jgi:hypothetical protein
VSAQLFVESNQFNHIAVSAHLFVEERILIVLFVESNQFKHIAVSAQLFVEERILIVLFVLYIVGSNILS